LASEFSVVKCCFEATGETALEAMENVLQTVLDVTAAKGDQSNSSVATSI